MPPDTGEGVRVGVVEDGRVHPVLVAAVDGGNFASLASTRREWDVGGGGGDLTVVLTIFDDDDDEGI